MGHSCSGGLQNVSILFLLGLELPFLFPPCLYLPLPPVPFCPLTTINQSVTDTGNGVGAITQALHTLHCLLAVPLYKFCFWLSSGSDSSCALKTCLINKNSEKWFFLPHIKFNCFVFHDTFKCQLTQRCFVELPFRGKTLCVSSGLVCAGLASPTFV